MKKIFYSIALAATSILGIVFFLSFSKLFSFAEGSVKLEWKAFALKFKEITHIIFQGPDVEMFRLWVENGVFERYTYSLTVFILSALFTVICATIISFAVMMSPFKWKGRLKSIINFFEGIPDLLIIFLFQVLVITIYQKYEIKLVQLYGVNDSKPLLFPMLIISFLPIFFLVQFLIKSMEEEKDKHYILLAEAKGFPKLYVFVIHMIRNIIPLIAIQFRTIIWMLLSNLVLVEYMFVIQGYSKDLYHQLIESRTASVYAQISAIGFFILPILLFDLIVRMFVKPTVKKGEVHI